MSFKPNALFLTDGYKPGHKRMLAPGAVRLYGAWMPRSLKRAPIGITKIVSFGQQLVAKFIHDSFKDNFFNLSWSEAEQFIKDMNLYLGMPYDGSHFEDLWKLGYLPIRIKSLPEGIETKPGIPHMTFINTVDGYAWLTLYLETVISNAAWKSSTAATIAKLYRRRAEEWVLKTDPANMWLVDYMCHDFSGRGLSGWFDMVLVGLGHATSFRGSDQLIVIPASRYYYGVGRNEMPINSVNASEHSVSCTQLFYYESELKRGVLNDKIKEYYSFDLPSDGSIDNPDYLTIAEWLMLDDWLDRFTTGILSVVDDTMNTWKHITHVIARLKDKILARDGKLVTRPDSGNPVDIICGYKVRNLTSVVLDDSGIRYANTDDVGKVVSEYKNISDAEYKGVIELLWDIFGGTVNEHGYKVLDPHIGSLYGDSITTERQLAIYDRLERKGFAATNIVLGIGSYTYQYVTRDTFGWAAKGAWFEINEALIELPGTWADAAMGKRKSYDIYKDPATGDGTKTSLRGLQAVHIDHNNELYVKSQCTWEEESQGLLHVIYEDGNFHNQVKLDDIRNTLSNQK